MKLPESKFISTTETNEYYHSQDAYGSTSLKPLANGRPDEFKYFTLDGKGKKDPTPAMIKGTACHTAILEPEKFKDEYHVLSEDFNGRTKAGKEEIAKLIESGKQVIKQDLAEEVFDIRDSFRAHPVASKLLQGGVAEVSFRVPYVDYSLQVRPDYLVLSSSEDQASCLDWMDAGDSYILDLKTSNDLSKWSKPNRWNVVFDLSYDVQAALYLSLVSDVLRKEGMRGIDWFVFVVVENKPPYSTIVRRIAGKELACGTERLSFALTELSERMKSGDWSYDGGECQDIDISDRSITDMLDDINQ